MSYRVVLFRIVLYRIEAILLVVSGVCTEQMLAAAYGPLVGSCTEASSGVMQGQSAGQQH